MHAVEKFTWSVVVALALTAGSASADPEQGSASGSGSDAAVPADGSGSAQTPPPAPAPVPAGPPLGVPPSPATPVLAQPKTPEPPDDAGTYWHRNPKHYARLEALREPGLTTNFPPFIDSILNDVGGWRSALADESIGIEARSATSVIGQFNSSGGATDPQSYAGQKLTLQSASSSITGIYRFDKLGLPDTKFIANVTFALNSFNEQLGPNQITLQALYLYQSLHDKQVEFKIGFLGAQNEFVGFFLGGSPVLSNGLTGILPLAAGLTSPLGTTPAAVLTLNSKTGVYVKTALMRSTDPAGVVTEETDHDHGLRFLRDGAGPLWVGEAGIRRRATPTEHSIWLRAGGMYNHSDYPTWDSFRKKDATNGSIWAVVDYQVLQVDPTLRGAHRGLYVAPGYFWSPGDVNVYTQVFQLRLYGIGLLDLRPADALSLDISYKTVSDQARAFFAVAMLPASDEQFQVAATYSIHLIPGVYIAPGLAYLTNPSFVGKFNNAYLGSISAFLIF